MPRYDLTKEQASAMGKKGGKARGAVKKHQTLERQQIKQRLVKRFREEADEIFDGLIALAKGHFIVIQTDKGEQRVYKKSPETNAIKELFDRVWGKPQVNIEIEGQVDIIANLEKAIKQIADAGLNTTNREFSEYTLQEREGGVIEINPNTIKDIRNDIQKVLSADSSDGAYEIREVVNSSSGNSNKSSDFSGEVGDSSSESTES